MELIVKQKGSACILAPDGTLDATGGEKLLALLQDPALELHEVIIDGLLWFDVTGEGLEALIRFREALEGRAYLRLRHIRPEILEILELTELIYGFEIEDMPGSRALTDSQEK